MRQSDQTAATINHRERERENVRERERENVREKQREKQRARERENRPRACTWNATQIIYCAPQKALPVYRIVKHEDKR